VLSFVIKASAENLGHHVEIAHYYILTSIILGVVWFIMLTQSTGKRLNTKHFLNKKLGVAPTAHMFYSSWS